jgi:hypothetical protein
VRRFIDKRINKNPCNNNLEKPRLPKFLQIWIILQQAIARRKADGSNQWQDGYPNPEVI